MSNTLKKRGWAPRIALSCEADYVHHIAYDYHGRRMAVCTSSKRISIFTAESMTKSEEPDDVNWIETGRIEGAHLGPIWRLAWGDPEWGEPLASCSEDHTVHIYVDKFHNHAKSDVELRTSVDKRWSKSARLEGEGPLTDVKFAPAHLGLKLAACTSDGKVRLWECADLIKHAQWDAEDLSHTYPIKGKQQGIGAVGQPVQTEDSMLYENMSTASLDWMPAPFGGSIHGDDKGDMFAVVGRLRRLSIWTKNQKTHKYAEVTYLDSAHSAMLHCVKDVAWCPNLCRTHEIIAVAGQGACLFRLDFHQVEGQGKNLIPGIELKLSLLSSLLDDPEVIVWRCSWNLVGTCLLLSTEGGKVSLWKATTAKSNTSNEWKTDWQEEFNADFDDPINPPYCGDPMA
eukprot:TRINITY_DN16733_c0_g1_i1.p1 TRINITY_DN16733_c0_g1~~TRINITY_DN16733_c0_g1_i1.p1  ORF type:complete len:399 (-),score=76.96 TRINITY_DN16733_c0_g1_i1:83-1279(-)